MLFAALTNAVCLYNASFFWLLIFANAFCFMLCLGLLTHSLFISSMIFHHTHDAYDVCMMMYVCMYVCMYDASCAVLLICSFFLIPCSHHFLYERAMCSGEIALSNSHYYYYYPHKHTYVNIYVLIFIDRDKNSTTP